MKLIIEQYASAVIAVFVSIVMFLSIANGSFFDKYGIPQVLGGMLEYSIGNCPIIENEAFEEYMSSAAPTITLKNIYLLKNQRVSLSECFEAKSNTGVVLPVILSRVWNAEGEEIHFRESPDGTTICLEETGIYWIQVYAVDDKQKRCSIVSKVLVNER